MSEPSLLSKNSYLLTKIFFTLGVLIFIFTFVLTAMHYQKHIDIRKLGYQQMLTTLQTTYLYEMIEENERQLSALIALLDKKSIAQGLPAANATWPVAHKIKMESNHYIFFYNHQNDLLETYPDWERTSHFQAQNRPWYTIIEHPTHTPVWIGPYEEYNTQQSVLSLGQTVFDNNGKVLGTMIVDMSLETLDTVLKRMSGDLNVSLFLRQRKTEKMLSVVNQHLLTPEYLSANDAFFSIKAFTQGALLTQPLPYIDWELGIYVPAERFQAAFINELIILILPSGAITLMMILGIYSLLRIFRQELNLIEYKLSHFNHKELSPTSHHQAWFIDRSLTTIEKQYYSQLLKLRIDPLTGILNRRAFDDDLCHFSETLQHYTLILIDIDLFKQINDTFGHRFGDLVLKRTGKVLTDILGKESVYRIGGDEFACLLPTDDKEQLKDQLAQLVSNINQLQWSKKTCRTTVSVGATIGVGSISPLFERADSALYQSKTAGRNCWHLG